MPAMTINGVDTPAHAEFDVLNPSTGEVCGTAPEATKEQVDEAMAAASDAFTSWRQDESFRVSTMMELSGALMGATPELADILAEENGKTLDLGGMEGMVAAVWLDYYANLERPREILRDDEGARVEVLRRPMGVVGAITPWNMPIGLAFFKIAPALRAGNTVVLKPSPFTPLSTLRLGEIIRDVLPPGVVNVVTGGDDVGRWISGHPVPRKISFTGSVEAGRSVNAAAAADLKRVTLELGGNDPAVLLDDVDIAEIAEGLFWTGFFNNGQACTLVKRVYVPQAIHADVVEALAEVARRVKVGDPTQEETQLGPLSTRPQFERVSELVEHALAHGAKAAAGGRPIDGPGLFFEPTILTDVSDGLRVVDEEQFGPVLPVIPYTDLDDAIARANASSYGLGASVWSADLDRGADVARRLDAGNTWVNTHAALNQGVPFGGIKWSGLGVENGPWGLHAYTDIQVLHQNRGVPGPGAL
jgi:acyl-CoA reductase-like NAD-dependent aldehyde dehydrogenase